MSRESRMSPSSAVRQPESARRERGRRGWAHRAGRTAATLLAAAALAGFTPATARQPDAGAGSGEGQNDFRREVEQRFDAMRDWISRHLSIQRAERLLDDVRGAAEDVARDMLDGARSAVEDRVGLSLYAPNAPATQGEREDAPEWIPLEADAALPPRVVVLIHGLDEPGDVWSDLAPAAHDDGHTLVRFDYPNDQAIEDSADIFVQALARLKRLGVQKADLVCHSMGGLVARDALTRSRAAKERAAAGDESNRDGENPASPTSLPEGEGRPAFPDVGRLIMIGTPNYGAPLAKLRLVTEAREHLSRWIDFSDNPGAHPLAFLGDGAGEAGDDLKPGSDFLKKLNARPLPKRVRITIIAGALAPIDGGALADLFESDIARRILGERADRLAREVRGLASTIGDGVTPLDSARLAGVKDIVVVEANHRSMLKTLAIDRATGDAAAPPPAIAVILDRLAPPGASE